MKKIGLKKMKQICIKYNVDEVQTENFINLINNYNDIVGLYKVSPTEKLLSLSLRHTKQINDTINNFIQNYNKYKKDDCEYNPSPLQLIKDKIDMNDPFQRMKMRIEKRNE